MIVAQPPLIPRWLVNCCLLFFQNSLVANVCRYSFKNSLVKKITCYLLQILLVTCCINRPKIHPLFPPKIFRKAYGQHEIKNIIKLVIFWKVYDLSLALPDLVLCCLASMLEPQKGKWFFVLSITIFNLRGRLDNRI